CPGKNLHILLSSGANPSIQGGGSFTSPVPATTQIPPIHEFASEEQSDKVSQVPPKSFLHIPASHTKPVSHSITVLQGSKNPAGPVEGCCFGFLVVPLNV
ncbi:unnamed protein product, partial [marine sediment metagenome]